MCYNELKTTGWPAISVLFTIEAITDRWIHVEEFLQQNDQAGSKNIRFSIIAETFARGDYFE